MSLVRKFATVGGTTLGSRVLGFARETLMAAALGTGPMADAFYAAFRFPNLFRRLFAEGAFNAAFVPLFAKEIEAGGIDGAKRFSEEVFGVLFTVLLMLTIAMELLMPLIVAWVIAPGFVDDAEKFDVTVKLAVVMFPYLMCMSLTAMLSGMLNSLHHYFAAAVAPVFLNVVLIGALGYALWQGASPLETAWYLSWGVLAAGLLQMAVLYAGVRHAGMKIGFRRPRMTPNVKRLLWLAFPAAITGGITQINQLIGQMIASTKDGAISALQYADRVYQLPLGVVGIAVGVVLLPELARALKGGHEREAGNLQNRSMEFVLFLTLPAAAALWVISDEIVRVLYERGAFSPETTAVVAGTLAIYGLGLPGFVLIKALNPGFFARGHQDADAHHPVLRRYQLRARGLALPAVLRARHRHRRGRFRLGDGDAALRHPGTPGALAAGKGAALARRTAPGRGRRHGGRARICLRLFRRSPLLGRAAL
jgi:putative peptidoglycan lipid II flippase